MKFAFDELGNRRLEWKCDSANNKSSAAALRLGYRREGIFRSILMYKGRNRDTLIIKSEWKRIKHVIEGWLEDCDDHGKQRQSLQARQIQ